MSRPALAILIIYFLKTLVNVSAVPTAGESVSDPCENYSSYVCKNANKDTALNYWRRPNVYPHIDNYSEKIRNRKSSTEAERKYFDLMKYCANITRQDKKDLIESFNFPKYNKGLLSDKFDFEDAMTEMLSAGLNPMYTLAITTSSTFENRLIINRIDYMYPLNIHYDYRRNLVRNEALSDYIENKEEVINDSASVMDTYFSIKHQHQPRLEITDIKGLKEKIPEYNWDRQIAAYFGQKLPDDYVVHIHNFELVKRFIEASMNMPSKVIANFLLLNLAESATKFNTGWVYNIFDEVEYQYNLKQLYSDANRKELKIMLYSFLKTLQNIGKLSNNDTQFEIEISEFINKVILPDAKDDYLSDLFKDIEISPNQCLSTYYKLDKIVNAIRFKGRLDRRTDFLDHLQGSLKNSLVEYLPVDINKKSPYKFLSFLWQAALAHGELKRPVDNYERLKQCFEEQNPKFYAEYELTRVIQIQILMKAYFEWMKSNGDFVKSEEQQFHFNAKEFIFEKFLEPYCSNYSSSESEKHSNYIENLDEFSEVYNCPKINSKFPNKCQLK